MESKNELKEIDIKNRACYYIVIVHIISSKNSKGAKPFRVRFDKISASIKIHDKIKSLYVLVMSRMRFKVNPQPSMLRN